MCIMVDAGGRGPERPSPGGPVGEIFEETLDWKRKEEKSVNYIVNLFVTLPSKPLLLCLFLFRI